MYVNLCVKIIHNIVPQSKSNEEQLALNESPMIVVNQCQENLKIMTETCDESTTAVITSNNTVDAVEVNLISIYLTNP